MFLQKIKFSTLGVLEKTVCEKNYEKVLLAKGIGNYMIVQRTLFVTSLIYFIPWQPPHPPEPGTGSPNTKSALLKYIKRKI